MRTLVDKVLQKKDLRYSYFLVTGNPVVRNRKRRRRKIAIPRCRLDLVDASGHVGWLLIDLPSRPGTRSMKMDNRSMRPISSCLNSNWNETPITRSPNLSILKPTSLSLLLAVVLELPIQPVKLPVLAQGKPCLSVQTVTALEVSHQVQLRQLAPLLVLISWDRTVQPQQARRMGCLAIGHDKTLAHRHDLINRKGSMV